MYIVGADSAFDHDLERRYSILNAIHYYHYYYYIRMYM
jgi:hypothetical protein